MIWILFATLISTSIVRAEPGALVVAGKSTVRDQDVATRAISEALRSAGWVLPDKPPTKAEGLAVGRCFKDASPSECVLHAIRGARRVAFVSIDPDPSVATGLQFTARIVVASVPSVMVATQYCDHCTDDSIATSAKAATKMLLDRLLVESGRTVLSVQSVPQGARFSVDGAFVGPTDGSLDVTPGTHLVSIEQDGFETAIRTVEAVEGKTSEVSVTLRRLDAGTHTPTSHQDRPSASTAVASTTHDEVPAPHPSLVLPVTLVALGGVAIVGGVIALALNDSSQNATAGQPQRQYYRDTFAPGIVAIAGGVVVGGVGGYLWWRYTRSTTTPAVATVTGGAVMTLSGSF